MQIKETSEEIARLTEDKDTAEFQVQEAAVQLEELKERLADAQTQQATLKKEAESNNRYQQEIEGDVKTTGALSTHIHMTSARKSKLRLPSKSPQAARPVWINLTDN